MLSAGTACKLRLHHLVTLKKGHIRQCPFTQPTRISTRVLYNDTQHVMLGQTPGLFHSGNVPSLAQPRGVISEEGESKPSSSC